MIELKRDSWHYRRYARWEQWKRSNRGTLDLCHYVRVVLIFYSLRWPFQRRLFGSDITPIICLIGAAWLALVGFTILGLTRVSNWSKVGIIFGIAIGLLVLAAVLTVSVYYAFAEKKLHVVVGESETFKLTKGYVKAKKNRVCPLLKRPDAS